MESLIVLVFLVAGFLTLAALSIRFGVDSRSGSSDTRRREPGLLV